MCGNDLKLTFSGISLYNKCPKAYEYRYIKKIVRADDDHKALRFGSLVHAGLANHWLNEPLYNGIRCGEWVGTNETTISQVPETLEIDELKALAMIEAYHLYYNSDLENYKVEAIEARFESNKYKGQVDGVIIDNGVRMLLEHKTAAEVDEAYWEHLNIDLQIRLYAANVKVTSVLYDVLQKPKIRQKKDETIKDFLERYKAAVVFSRRTVYINADTISDALGDAATVRNDIINNRFPRARSSCKGLYACPYMQLCARTAQEGTYIERAADNELTGAAVYGVEND